MSEIHQRADLLALNYDHDILPPSIFTSETADTPPALIRGGRYGDVYRASRNGYDLAFKVLRGVDHDHDHSIRKVFTVPFHYVEYTDRDQMFGREALMLASMDHPSILPFLGLDSTTFPNNIAIITPWCTHETAVAFLAAPENHSMRNPIVSGYAHHTCSPHADDI